MGHPKQEARSGSAVERFMISLPGGLDGSDEPTGPPELKGVCVCDVTRTHFSGLVLRSVEITR